MEQELQTSASKAPHLETHSKKQSSEQSFLPSVSCSDYCCNGNNPQKLKDSSERVYLKNKHPGIKLIINADDFGYCQQRNDGILQLLEKKTVNSVSVMVNMMSLQDLSHEAQRVLNRIRHQKEHCESSNGQSQGFLRLSVGLHFNLTEGDVLSKPQSASLASIKFIQPSGCEQVSKDHRLCSRFSFLGKQQLYQYFQNLRVQGEKLLQQEEDFIGGQFRAQVLRFFEVFGFLPSHVDGHNHVHIFPEVISKIAPVMQQLGIYRARLPIEQLEGKSVAEDSQKQSSLHTFNRKIVDMAHSAKSTLIENNIVFPGSFLGLDMIGQLNTKSLRQKLSLLGHSSDLKCKDSSPSATTTTVELMCHPGYANTLNQGDQFNQSTDREAELQVLKSAQFESQVLSLVSNSSFYCLEPTDQYSGRSVLIYSKMEIGSGNWTTSLRLKRVFEHLGFRVYLRPIKTHSSVDPELTKSYETARMRNFIHQFRVSLAVGVNLKRSAEIIHQATRSKSGISNKVPYWLVVAGTDANILFKAPTAHQLLYEPIKESSRLISLSRSMLEITQDFLTARLQLPEKKVELVSQSSDIRAECALSHSELSEVRKSILRQFSIDVENQNYILLPTSFREVKDVKFLLKAFNELIDKYQGLRVLILGPILDQSYFDECLPELGNVEYIGTVSQREMYVQLLRHAFCMVNSSISEGQSCSIQEALEIGQVCIVRDNEGNRECIKHMETGLLFHEASEFKDLFCALWSNSTQGISREFLTQNSKKFHKENYSIDCEIEKYRHLVEELFPNDDLFLKLISYADVHPVSSVNLELFRQIPVSLIEKHLFSEQSDHFETGNCSKLRLIDMGCGSGVFGLTVLKNILEGAKAPINLTIEMYDYTASIVSNAFYNLIQSRVIHSPRVEKASLAVSDMFQAVKYPSQPERCLLIANMPQTPFRNSSTRPDKNGGADSMKFNKAIVEEFADNFNANSLLVMLFSSMCNPREFYRLLEEKNLDIIWKGPESVHRISRESYESMEEGLSDFIRDHIQKGNAEGVKVQNSEGKDMFLVPARILIIAKRGE